MGCKNEAALFPKYHYFGGFRFDEPLKTVERLDQILQNLDPTMTSHMFRYGASERYLRMGYTPIDLKEIGDWASSKMPELYAEKKNLTPAQKRFSNDSRVT